MDLFPVLPGLTWSVVKAPKFATRIQKSISGRELRVLDQPYPIYEWTLTYAFLRDKNDVHVGPGLGSQGGYDELRALMGFFIKQQGSFQTFLYNDPTDSGAANAILGTGNGVTTSYQLVRSLGGYAFAEPITQPTSVTVYIDGVPAGFVVGANGIVTIDHPPPAGSQVSATFQYNWPVRFSDDTNEWENFMYQLWEMKRIKFQSVLLP